MKFPRYHFVAAPGALHDDDLTSRPSACAESTSRRPGLCIFPRQNGRGDTPEEKEKEQGNYNAPQTPPGKSHSTHEYVNIRFPAIRCRIRLISRRRAALANT